MIVYTIYKINGLKEMMSEKATSKVKKSQFKGPSIEFPKELNLVAMLEASLEKHPHKKAFHRSAYYPSHALLS